MYTFVQVWKIAVLVHLNYLRSTCIHEEKDIYMTAKVFKENSLQHDNEEIYIYIYQSMCGVTFTR